MWRWLLVIVAASGCVKRQQLVMADIDEVLATRAEALFPCFAGQSEPSKTLLVRFAVSTDGRPTEVRVSSPEWSGHPSAACALQVIEATTFPVSEQGSSDVTVPLLPPRSLPVRDDSTALAEAGLSREQIMSTVLAQKAPMARCFHAAQRKGMTGKLVLVWDVTPEGRVENVGVRTSEYATAEVALCLADTMRTWRFPAVEVATNAIVFPFKF